MPLRLRQRSMSATKSSGSSRAVELVEEGDLGVGGGDHGVGVGTPCRPRARRRTPGRCGRGSCATGAVDPDLGAERPGRSRRWPATPHPCRRSGSPRPHAAGHRALADVADRVVHHHVGGARLVGAGPGADDAVDAQQTLDLGGLEPLVEQVGDAHREQPGDVGGAAHVEVAHAPGQPACSSRSAGRREPTFGGGSQEQRVQRLGDALQPRLVPGVGGGVLGGEPARAARGRARGRRVSGQRPLAVGERQVARAHRDDRVAVALAGWRSSMISLRHQAHHVGQRGHLVVGPPRRLGRGGAADRVAGLQHQRSAARPGPGRPPPPGRCARRRRRSRRSAWSHVLTPSSTAGGP